MLWRILVCGFLAAIPPATLDAQPFAYVGTHGSYWPSHTCYLEYCPRTWLRVVNTTTGHEVARVTLADSDLISAVVVVPVAGRAFVSRYPSWSPPPGDPGHVTVVDIETNTVVAHLEAGYHPTVRAALPDGSAVLVTNESGASEAAAILPQVRVLTIATGASTLVATGAEPAAMAVSPDGRFVYVANAGSNDVTVVDTQSWVVVTTIPVGTRPVALALSPDGRRLYVANQADDSISAIDTVLRAVVSVTPVMPQPSALAVTSDGARLAVSTWSREATPAGALYVVDTATMSFAPTTAPLYVSTLSASADPQLVYVASELTGDLTTVDVTTLTTVRSVRAASGIVGFGASAGCVFEVSPLVEGFRPEGGSGVISVPAPAGCAWRASPPPDWITWTSASSGIGTGAITYDVSAAPAPREAYLTVSGQTIRLVQAFPSLFVDTPVPGTLATSPFQVGGWALNQQPYFYCYGLPDSECHAGIESVSASLLPEGGGAPIGPFGLSSGLRRPDVAEQFGPLFRNRYEWSGFDGVVSGVPAGRYTLQVLARSVWGRALDQTRDVPIIVADPCAAGTTTVSPTAANVGAGGGPVTVTVTSAGTTCGWGATSGVPWITPDPPAGGIGSGTTVFTVAPTTSGLPRTGTLAVAGHTVTVTQSGAPCSYSLASASALVGPLAASVPVSVTRLPADCPVNPVSTAPWLTPAAPTCGPEDPSTCTVSISVAPLSGADRTGSVTIGGQTFAVTQSERAVITLNRWRLTFGVKGDHVTGPQTVTVTSELPVAWTAVPYGNVTVSVAQPGADASAAVPGPISGTGPAVLSISLLEYAWTGNDPPVLIGLFAPGAPSVAISIAVNVVDTSALPFGQIDTPAQGAAGIQGGIGITGWALDDVEVREVRVYRNCMPFDLPVNCELIYGERVVYLGTARFLDDARPDVEAAFPDSPRAYRAGWGLQVLTNMLPHVPNGQPFGGQGPVTFYALARNPAYQGVWLGRTRLDQAPTSVTLDNDRIAAPFGAIDTPAPGSTLSGRVPVFGWAITPDVDTIAGNGAQADGTDILIPTDGSTIAVFVDGVATAAVAYNHCRGDVGTPPPAGVFCNDDIGQIFGNPLPQSPPPPFIVRTSNDTRYRNLDAGRGAIGVYTLDTTALTNGLHTLAWSVTDSAGRTTGIGSRFFVVFNTGTGDRGPGISSATRATRSPKTLFSTGPRSLVHGPAEAAVVHARVGFDLRAPFVPLAPDADGVRRLAIPELGRVELHVGPVRTGYLLANGERRAFPAGSSLDAATGVFTWAPPAGYFGTYTFQFGPDIVVDVTVGSL